MSRALLLLVFISLFAGDWPEWRGPSRDGTSRETGLPEKWSLSGENLAWKAPYGARSAPVVYGNHLYLQNGAGEGETLQERLLSLDADTGKLLWERRWTVYLSDVPPHRIAWASPAVDPETENVYGFGANGLLTAFTRDGKQLWQRSLKEDFGLFTTHGGRTGSPLIDGDLVIVSHIVSTWGAMSNRSHRIIAFDKRTGETVWISTPGGRPYDTAYSNPIITEVNGTRLLIQGLGDGSVVAVKPQTGEPVWRFEMAKRGINSAVVMAGGNAIVTHSEENLDTNVMGLVGALDPTGKGALTMKSLKWSLHGFEAGFSSPLADGSRLYVIDNTANLQAFDAATGEVLWKMQLGLAQKASPVLADGKIYVGTESGKFYILRPRAGGVDVLCEVNLPVSASGLYSKGTPEPVWGSAAVARGRVYFATTDSIYAIGPKAPRVEPPYKPAPLPKGQGAPAWLQIRPTEHVVKPGQAQQFRAVAYDAQGRSLGDVKPGQWSLNALDGAVAAGLYKAPATTRGQAGIVSAALGALKGEARVRLVRLPPYTEDFESWPAGAPPPHWVSAVTGSFQVAELDGQKVLYKQPLETLFRRMRVFFGPNDLSNYTVEADIRANERRRQMGDAGIFAQRYGLVLFGNSQKLELQPWQPNTAKSVDVPFEWKKDEWYRLKLRVENLPGGKVRVLGKAWKRDTPEPANWLIDKIDPIGSREGSPGIFGDAQFGVYYDNIKVSAN
jgi:outer membrane protein assembly factor BamB